MGRTRIETHLPGAEETRALAKRLAPKLRPNAILALYGPLGAGKTTFVQGLVEGLLPSKALVQSPTFTYLNIYETTPPVFHFDLYRLQTSGDFFSLGFEEYFEQGGICAIEWPERIASILPAAAISIRLSIEGLSRRAVIE